MKVVLVVPVRGKTRWNGCVHWATDIAECIRFAFAGCVECELLEVNLDDLATEPRAPVDLAVRLEKANVDIFHTHNMYLALEPHALGSLLAHLSQSKLKWLESVHDVGLSFDMIERGTRYLAQTNVITHSRFNQDRINRLWKRNVPVVRLGINTKNYGEIKLRSDIPEFLKLFCPGRLVAAKGALRVLMSIVDNCDIVGPVEFRVSAPTTNDLEFVDALHHISKGCELVRITTISPTASRFEIFQDTHVTVVCPVQQEGFGLVGLESLACAVPLILAPRGGMHDWAGSMPGAHCTSISGLGESLSNVRRNYPRAVHEASKGRTLIQKSLDINHSAAALVEVYKQVMGRSLNSL